jgi:perosamine synthetase
LKPRRIPSAGPSITEKEVALVTEAVRDGWYENMSRHLDQFVEEFTTFTGVEYCLPTANCTSAIHLTLMALEVGPGDEVIVPDISWVATAAPVAYVGADVVLVDIDPNTWCISPESFERAITERTRAVIAVGLVGNLPDMDTIQAIAERHGIAVVEDAAESMGATYKGRKAGTLGRIGVYSFNATKIAIAGQGGMLVTDDEVVYDRVKSLAHHGIDKSPGARYYWSHEIGYNYTWTNIQAALALAQLRRLDELVDAKRQAHAWYRSGLQDLGSVRLNYEPKDVRSTFWLNVAFVDPGLGIGKEELQERFKPYGIDARPFFYPISSMPPYSGYSGGRDMRTVNPVAYGLSPFGICLPSSFSLTEDDAAYVCDSLKEILGC